MEAQRGGLDGPAAGRAPDVAASPASARRHDDAEGFGQPVRSGKADVVLAGEEPRDDDRRDFRFLTRNTRPQIIDHLPDTIHLAPFDDLDRLESVECAVGLLEPRPYGVFLDHLGERTSTTPAQLLELPQRVGTRPLAPLDIR